MANVCFTCNEVADIIKCKKHDCFAYSHRKEHLAMDHELNKNNNIMARETFAKIVMGRSAIVRY